MEEKLIELTKKIEDITAKINEYDKKFAELDKKNINVDDIEIIASKNGQERNYKLRKYTRIKERMRPLDLICFRGDDFVSNSIAKMQKRMLGNGDWTHVGIIVNTDILPIKNGIPGRLYIWESTMSGKLTDGVNSTETDAAKFGVQIRDLEKVLNAYVKNDITKMAWCKLRKNPLFGENAKQIRSDLVEFYKQHGNDTYDYKVLPLLKTIFPCLGRLRYFSQFFQTKNNFFCSELVATIYCKIGIIPAEIDPENIAPVEFLGYSNDGIPALVDDPIILF